MRIALLTSTRERCGVAAYSRSLAEALSGHVEVDVVPVEQQPPSTETLARLNSADLIHIQHEYSFWGSALPGRSRFPALRRQITSPVVLTAHTVAPAAAVAGLEPGRVSRGSFTRVKRWLVERGKVGRFIERSPFEGAREIIVHTPAARQLMLQRGFDQARVHHLPMPCPDLPPPASALEVRRALDIGVSPFLLTFGFLSPAKGFENAIAAMFVLPPPHLLVIAGDAPDEPGRRYRADLDRLARDIGVDRRVRLVGYQDDAILSTLLHEAEFTLLPYHSGTGSYAASLALAAGSVIVASEIPAFARLPVIRVPPVGQEIAAAILELCRDRTRRATLKAEGRNWAKRHSWAAAADFHSRLYRGVLGLRADPPAAGEGNGGT